LLFLAGNTAAADWKYKGKVGKDVTVQEGYDTARQVGLIMLAKVRAAVGSLDRVKRVVKVLGMVNSAEGFGDQPKVVNGFSDRWRSSAKRSGSMPAPPWEWPDSHSTMLSRSR
jgi:YjgF/chorismate_mutase-like, putative endoribonuclease